MLTLSVHKVGDGDRVVAGNLSIRGLEHGLGMGLGSETSVLLSEVLHLHIDGNGLLVAHSIINNCSTWPSRDMDEHLQAAPQVGPS